MAKLITQFCCQFPFRSHFHSTALLVGFCAAACLLAGCNPLTPALNGYVGGVIRYQGKPVTPGQVGFHGTGEPLVTDLRADGTYAIEGAPAGLYRVTITSDMLPEKYADPDTSELSVEVEPGTGPLAADFELR